VAGLGAPLVLDGAYGEGGGAVVRTALAMSALTQQPLRIENVRGAQLRQGLNCEDLTILRAFALSCAAETVGAEYGSKQVSFLPTRAPRALTERLDVPDADDGPGHANALVVLSTLAPVLCRTGAFSALFAVGETFGRNILGFDAFAFSTVPALQRLGLYCYPDLAIAGFGLKSRGEVVLEIEPSALHGASLTDRGELIAARAMVTTGELPSPIAERGVAHIARMAHSAGIPVDAEATLAKAKSPGAHVTIWAEFENGFGSWSSAGARGVRIESIAQQAFDGFHEWFRSGSTVDEHLADQLLVAAVLADGETILKVHRLTQRFLSMVWVIKQFVPIHITVKGQEGNPGTVTIKK